MLRALNRDVERASSTPRVKILIGESGSWPGIGDRLFVETQDWAGPPVVRKADDPYRVNRGRSGGKSATSARRLTIAGPCEPAIDLGA
jgi:hypothetical protein